MLAGLVVGLVNPLGMRGITRVIVGWDGGVLLYLVLAMQLFLATESTELEDQSEAQETGEWTVFTFTLAGILLSLAAIITDFSGFQQVAREVRDLRVALVCGTLVLSWLMTQFTFALRYAHEFYDRTGDGRVDGGLEFPGTERPDYLDFVYFSFVLGMTFQVSDVQITSRKLRRLATLHGLVGFLFNTVILALVVNIAAGLV